MLSQPLAAGGSQVIKGATQLPEASKAAVMAFLDWMNDRIPFLPWILLALAVIVAFLIARALLVKIRVDTRNRQAAEDATAARRAAEAVAEIANAENDRLRLILEIIDRSLRRLDEIDYDDTSGATNADGLRYLADWIVKTFAFERPDINKLVLWQPDAYPGAVLTAIEHVGVSPESSRAMKPPIYPQIDDMDTFAAKAYRNARTETCDDTKTDARYKNLNGHPPTQGYRSLVAVPIRHGTRVIGVYTVDSREVARFKPNAPISEQLDLYGRLFALFMVPTVREESTLATNDASITVPHGTAKAQEERTNNEPA